ncbi:uncharacterized protein EV420DRAFT_305047 [Desarmillaria tabescens]|uniref:F-box domain-containing protein n=1 Tax=Armillaria tabescens TaxID=1929756 RepID=A0AA39N5R8_ARMTA|nr:uncharacterized protein EV420DRAFT_305047 [Desarmillaria tabescens]KAK0459136.1 hypothetical protein EV420DRAFT_305047 [Desarmillaria tabescens]
MTPIPPELVLEVLTYICGCRDDLRACCLVCRAWRQLAQPFVFSELSLSLESHCLPWNRKFAIYPHLAQYVTRLNIWGGNWGKIDSASFVEVQPPLLEGPAILKLVRQLPNIKYLKIYDFFLPSEREIEILCHFTRLEWLEMHDVIFSQPTDLLDLMSQSVNLRGLHITDMEVRSPTGEPIGPSLHNHVDAVPKRLRNLKLPDPTESPYIVSWLLGGAFDLGDLIDLTLSWASFQTKRDLMGPQSFSYIDSFVNSVGAGIKRLRLNIETWEHTSEVHVNYMLEHFISKRALSSFIALDTLDIHSINRYINNDAGCLVDIERLLHHVTLPNLRKICITTRFTLNTADDLPSYKELPFWASLDRLLASSQFPSLQQLLLFIEVKNIHWDAHKFGLRFEDSDSDDEDSLSVVIPPLVTRHPWPEHPPTVDDVAAMITEQMPTLASQGCLLFRPAKMGRF